MASFQGRTVFIDKVALLRDSYGIDASTNPAAAISEAAAGFDISIMSTSLALLVSGRAAFISP